VITATLKKEAILFQQSRGERPARRLMFEVVANANINIVKHE
jgi:hypothetical protein